MLLVYVGTQRYNSKSKADSLNIEAESAVLSSITKGTDPNASNGEYIHFMPSSTSPTPQISGTTYYISCTNGNDSNSGLTINTPWKSLSKISQANIQPGDAILFQRGSICTGSLPIPWNGTINNKITISSYGTGELPIIQNNVNNTRLVLITGSYINIENLSVLGIAPSLEAGCDNNPKGYIIGFQLDDSSHHVSIKNSKASGNYAGVYIKSGSNNNVITNNVLTNNTMMNPLDVGGGGDAGAFGVLLHGDDNEVANNTINGHDACSYDYGRDGAAVEVYGGSRNKIHHNIASQNDHFSELGKSSSDTSATGNVYAYNIYTSTLTDSVFLNTRGEGHNYGPIYNTIAYNNSIYLTGSNSQGVVCSNCGTNILTLKNNILWANWKSIYASTSFNESNNIYWKTSGNPTIQGFTMSSTSKVANPLYQNPASNLHLQSSSPALNAGSNESVTAGFTTDLDEKTVPVGSAVDIGAYEI